MRWFFLQFNERLNTSYPILYDAGGGEGLDSRVSLFGKKWGFYQNFYTLAKGDIRNFEAVSKINIHQCLTYLAFEKEKNQIETELIKKAHSK